MITTLPELISPLTETEFAELLRSRTLMFRRGEGENRFKHLLDWATLRGVLESGAFPPGKLRITSESRSVSPLMYLDRGKVSPIKLDVMLKKGISLIVQPLDPYVPALDALCADIRKRSADNIKAGAIVTTGQGGALKIHYDKEDLIILQMEGTKRWLIYGPPEVNPVHGYLRGEPTPEGEPFFDEVLQPGDLMYVPAGNWHRCENGPGLSLHVAIFFVPPAGWHAVDALSAQLRADPLFRIPLTRFSSPDERAAHEAALRANLIEKVKQMSLSNLSAEREEAPPADPYD